MKPCEFDSLNVETFTSKESHHEKKKILKKINTSFPLMNARINNYIIYIESLLGLHKEFSRMYEISDKILEMP